MLHISDFELEGGEGQVSKHWRNQSINQSINQPLKFLCVSTFSYYLTRPQVAKAKAGDTPGDFIC